MAAAGLMDELLGSEDPKDVMFVSNVDNLGATVDLNILFHMVNNELDMVMEVCRILHRVLHRLGFFLQRTRHTCYVWPPDHREDTRRRAGRCTLHVQGANAPHGGVSSAQGPHHGFPQEDREAYLPVLQHQQPMVLAACGEGSHDGRPPCHGSHRWRTAHGRFRAAGDAGGVCYSGVQCVALRKRRVLWVAHSPGCTVCVCVSLCQLCFSRLPSTNACLCNANGSCPSKTRQTCSVCSQTCSKSSMEGACRASCIAPATWRGVQLIEGCVVSTPTGCLATKRGCTGPSFLSSSWAPSLQPFTTTTAVSPTSQTCETWTT